jgi:hypothetical protein
LPILSSAKYAIHIVHAWRRSSLHSSPTEHDAFGYHSRLEITWRRKRPNHGDVNAVGESGTATLEIQDLYCISGECRRIVRL